MARSVVLLLYFLSYFALVIGIGTQQCLTLRGTIKCGANTTISSKQVFLQLVDKDSSSYNDLMDEGYVGKSGSFHLSGCASDPLGNIDPLLIIHHKCKGQPKKVTIVIPDAAIGHEYKYTQDIDLQRQFRNEASDKSPVPVCRAEQHQDGQLSGRYYFF